MKRKKTIIQKLNDLIRRARVPKYLNKSNKGPKIYTARQHIKCLLLRQKLKCTYEELVDDYLPYFGVKDIPERSTLIKFAKRVPAYLWNKILSLSAGEEECEVGAIDATGISKINTSYYYLNRINSSYPVKSYLKLSTMVNVTRRKFLSARLRAKPVHDTRDVKYLIENSLVLPETNLMDKGYDDNKIHSLFRDKGVYSIIPPRNKNVPIRRTKGQYRKEMKRYFDYGQYWQRNIVETLFSCLKRKFGGSVNSRNIRTQRADIFSRMILFNIFFNYWILFSL